MTEGGLLILMLVAQLGFIFVGIPVMYVLLAIPLAVAGLGVLLGVFDAALLGAIPSRIYGVLSNQILYAVPLFVVMGKLLEHSGLATALLSGVTDTANKQTKRLPFIVLGICVLIAASTGVVGATITMLVSVALPAMLNSGLSKRFSAGLICAGGSLGQIVPPSIVLILLSDQISNANLTVARADGDFAVEPITVGHLFAGALLPALALVLIYGFYLAFVMREGLTQQIAAPNSQTGSFQKGSSSVGFPALIVLGILVLVPLTILAGIATPTEAGAVGAAVCFLACIAKGQATQITKAFQESAILTGVIFGIVVAASVFALVFRGLDGDVLVEQLLTAIPNASLWALLIVMALVFVLGFFLEFVEITYIVVPIAAPVLFSLGVDPIWFAVLMAVNLQISFLTPPMGIALFYYKSAASIETLTLYRSIIPYVLIQIAVLMLIFCFPPLATWLPTQLI